VRVNGVNGPVKIAVDMNWQPEAFVKGHDFSRAAKAAEVIRALEHFAFWYRVNLLLGSRLPVAERTGSAGLPAGCRVDLPVHAALYTNRKNALAPEA
jgi:hypothetical protein